MEQLFDIAVIGGGINGCGIAADAALRGLSVILIEKDDLASKTSSSSSKLIHGGIRYLEYYNFSLVKKALDERQMLLKLAPHLVHPLPFVLPFQKSLRPAWLLRTGLFLYDHLSRKNKLPKSQLINRSKHPTYFDKLAAPFNKGFLYYDCSTDDARLTISNALQAKEHGAFICPHTELISGQIIDKVWHLQTQHSNLTKTIKARTVVNATGPWLEYINQRLGIENYCKISLVKGSHIVVDRLYEGEHAYLLQNTDKRIVFVIPYFGFSLIGTTDVNYSGDPAQVAIDDDEIHYLFAVIKNYFNRQFTLKDIITTWSGVRPLLSSDEELPQALSRDYITHFTEKPAPAISIYGGKITTYRQLSRHAIDKLHVIFPKLGKSLTAKNPLPGAPRDCLFSVYEERAYKKYSWLPPTLLQRLLTTYGTRIDLILNHCEKLADLGEDLGHQLYEKEINYLVNQEWAKSADDILWRRTKLGLMFNEQERKKLENYLSPSPVVVM